MGPWRHSQVNYDAYNLGPLKWDGDTALQFRRDVLQAVLRSIPENRCAEGRHAARVHLQHRRESLGSLEELAAGLRTGLRRAAEAAVSGGGLRLGIRQAGRLRSARRIPTSPIPPSRFRISRARFASPMSDRWRTWLVTDQRSVADRTDVLTYRRPVLTAPVRISGAPIADLFAATTGTDADWVVKLIDVFPDEVPSQPEMGGYELSVSMDIFRGRYRESFEHPSAIPAGKPQRYRFALPTTNHVFLARPSDHGADPVQLVSAVRPEPADLRAEYFLRQAVGLCEGDGDRVPLRRISQRDLVAGGELAEYFRVRMR